MKDIPPKATAREYHDFIKEYSQDRIASFVNIQSCQNILYATVVFKENLYTLIHDLSSGQQFMFESTSEGIKFQPDIFDGELAYKFIDSSSLNEYIKREILDVKSQNAYDRIISSGGCGVLKYQLNRGSVQE